MTATSCATCHETGKSWFGVTIVTRPTPVQDPNHPTTGECATCHTSTTSFTTGVTGGKPANHIPTTAACTLCHTNTITFKPGVMNHTGHHQRLHDVSRGEHDRDGVHRGDAEAAGRGPHPDHGAIA